MIKSLSGDFSKKQGTNLKTSGQVAIHFHPADPQPNTLN